jgi:hypothetical protein
MMLGVGCADPRVAQRRPCQDLAAWLVKWSASVGRSGQAPAHAPVDPNCPARRRCRLQGTRLLQRLQFGGEGTFWHATRSIAGYLLMVAPFPVAVGTVETWGIRVRPPLSAAS